MYASTISSEEINELDLNRFEGKITVITQANKIPGVLRSIASEPAIGFDTETKPSFKKGEFNDVSLIQLATEEAVFLIRINYTGLTDELIRFLENKNQLKIGVALRDDLKDLRKLRNFTPGGFLELNRMVTSIGIESNGLRKLTAIILGFRISKSAQISNWESEKLSEKQLSYAATDAWVCIKMYNQLLRRGYLDDLMD